MIHLLPIFFINSTNVASQLEGYICQQTSSFAKNRKREKKSVAVAAYR